MPPYDKRPSLDDVAYDVSNAFIPRLRIEFLDDVTSTEKYIYSSEEGHAGSADYWLIEGKWHGPDFDAIKNELKDERELIKHRAYLKSVRSEWPYVKFDDFLPMRNYTTQEMLNEIARLKGPTMEQLLAELGKYQEPDPVNKISGIPRAAASDEPYA